MESQRQQLSPKEVGTRIKAARLLTGITQEDLAQRLDADGLPYTLAGKLERATIRIQPVHVRALSLAMGLPECWFTDTLDEIFFDQEKGGERGALARIEAALARIEDALKQ